MSTATPEELMKSQEEFFALPPEKQKEIRASQVVAYEQQETALDKIKAYAELDEVKKRFVNLLGDKQGRAYVESVVIAVSANDALKKCTPKSIMVSAMRAASLKLSVDPIMKQAHLVPMGDTATLIVDYHGLTQLSVNTGYYEIAPNVFEVFEGEDVITERFSGKVTIEGKPILDKDGNKKTIGWCGYFKAKNGTERFLYMTNDQLDAHGKKYSKSFTQPNSPWNKEREKMRRKSVLRLLVSMWGNFSPEVKNVIMADEPLEGEVFDMPSDADIVLPDPPEAEEVKGKAKSAMEDLGFGEKSKRIWSDAQLNALVTAKLSPNEHGSRGMLDYSSLPITTSLEGIVAWGRLYRELRPDSKAKVLPAEAAQYANENWSNNVSA